MPGMFGVVGMDHAFRSRVAAAFSAPWPAVESVALEDCLFGAHAHPPKRAVTTMESAVVLVDGEVSIYDHAPGSLWKHMPAGIEVNPDCRGNVAVWEPGSRRLSLATEWTGSFPLYYAHLPGRGVAFSSRMTVLAGAMKASPDALGLAEFLRDACFLTDRSLWRGIRRLQPGQAVTYEGSTDHLTVAEHSQLWTGRSLQRNPEALAAEGWERLGPALGAAAETSIMVSGGWDSRTLLARCISAVPRERFLGYSHGDPSSREVRLAQRLCGDRGIAFHQEPIDYRCYELGALQEGFAKEEHVVFPHWHRAGRIAAKLGPRVVTAGVYGEVLGGHYGRAMLLQGAAKIWEVLAAILGSRGAAPDASEAELSALRSSFHVGRLNRPWVIRDDWWRESGVSAEGWNNDVDLDVTRLIQRGVVSTDQLIEAFVSEHRGSQYINAQIRSCRAATDISLPFADRELLQWAGSLPLGSKIHNRLNREMLRQFEPSLLRYPMAATLTAAKRPLLMQETSRLVRKGVEAGRWKAHFVSRGRIGSPRLSWVNFEFLRSGNELMELALDLRSDCWDRAGIIGRIEEASRERAIPAHSLSDYLMKVYTVDLSLRST